VKEKTPFVKFTAGDMRNPGAFTYGATLALEPAAPYVECPVAILVDEITLSQAEYTTMAFRSRPGTLVVGSQTSGADGNVSRIALPGGQSTMFSGIGVFYPDGRPTQQVGIVPDLEVKPTIAGIRAGRDEVLEAAVRRVLGREISAAELAALAASGEKPVP
jgi:C-terminal processing protease CtpA/Prc